jgi:uncharacterized protein YjbI with pentapeptide repeats
VDGGDAWVNGLVGIACLDGYKVKFAIEMDHSFGASRMSPNKDTPSDIHRPELPADSELIPWSNPRLCDAQHHAEVAIGDLSLEGTKAKELEFDGVAFSKTNLSRTRWSMLRLVDGRLLGCDLANAQWLNANLRRIEMSRCRLTGVGLARARIGHTRFTDCKCDHAGFQESVFESCQFDGCDLREADFQEADLRGVVFAGCDLRGATLVGAKLAGADFRGSTVDGLNVRGEDLRGAIVNASQAIGFAALVGIVVKGCGVDEPNS